MIPKQIALFTCDEEMIEKAKSLARDLNLPFIFGEDPLDHEETAAYPFLLVMSPHALQLRMKNSREDFFIDFLSGKMRHRIKYKGLRREFLARAIGMHPSAKPFIVDATAGLGRDSLILASLGFEITLLERSPILYVLLKDALSRAQSDQTFAPITARMHLIHTDALLWLEDHLTSNKKPDVIYLDPMFPQKKKSASVKKEMVILQELLGKDEDPVKLFDLALACAKIRVVVKRPRLAAFLAGYSPDFSIKGKSSRFDVYLASK